MGFFDKLKEGAKKLTDKVTGGYGNINFELKVDNAGAGERVPITFIVNATGELKANAVLVTLRGVEECEMDVDVRDINGNMQHQRQSVTVTTKEEVFQISGPIEMKEGDTRDFSGEIVVPQGCLSTYFGINCRHFWTVEARVDVPWGADLCEKREIYIR